MSFEPAHEVQPDYTFESVTVFGKEMYCCNEARVGGGGDRCHRVAGSEGEIINHWFEDHAKFEHFLRERSEWAGEVERLEKREQQLKNKIKELAVEFESWRTTNDSNLGFSFGVFLKQHSEELLGLSKQ